jgi:hypothetical protein
MEKVAERVSMRQKAVAVKERIQGAGLEEMLTRELRVKVGEGKALT